MSRQKPSQRGDRTDPVLTHARREAIVILAAFLLFLIWSVSWCYLAGYRGPTEHPLPRVLGIPSWVFWGVLVPWLVADVFALWFCFFFMADDPLQEGEGEDEVAATAGETPCRDAGEEGRHA